MPRGTGMGTGLRVATIDPLATERHPIVCPTCSSGRLKPLLSLITANAANVGQENVSDGGGKNRGIGKEGKEASFRLPFCVWRKAEKRMSECLFVYLGQRFGWNFCWGKDLWSLPSSSSSCSFSKLIRHHFVLRLCLRAGCCLKRPS